MDFDGFDLDIVLSEMEMETQANLMDISFSNLSQSIVDGSHLELAALLSGDSYEFEEEFALNEKSSIISQLIPPDPGMLDVRGGINESNGDLDGDGLIDLSYENIMLDGSRQLTMALFDGPNGSLSIRFSGGWQIFDHFGNVVEMEIDPETGIQSYTGADINGDGFPDGLEGMWALNPEGNYVYNLGVQPSMF